MPSVIRKTFYKRILYIFVFTVFTFFLLNREQGIFLFFALTFFIIVMYQLMRIIADSQSIIDDFFPPKVVYEKQPTTLNKFIYYFALVLFMGGLLLQVFEIKQIDNTIHGTKLFWLAGGIGLVLAILLTLILKKWTPSVYYESKRRYTVYFGFFLGFFLLIPAIANNINRNLANSSIKCTDYKIDRVSMSGEKDTFWIFLEVKNEKIERFEIDEWLYLRTKEGENIQLCTKEGKLGFEFVTQFKVKK